MKTQIKKLSLLTVLFFVFALARAGYVGSITANTTCHGNDGFIAITNLNSDGPAPYTVVVYNSSTGLVSADSNVMVSNDTISGLGAGSYYVQFYSNSFRSSTTLSVNIQVNSTVQIPQPTVTNTTCPANTGVISVTASGGTSPYSYLWSNGATTSSIGSLAGGQYGVTVTDASGCYSSDDTIQLYASSSVVAHIDSSGTGCGRVLTASITGGSTPATYVWSNGATTAAISNLSNNIYYEVTATDANGCTAYAYTLAHVTNIRIDSSGVVSPGCVALGSITPHILNGTAPYTYLWSTGATSSSISGLAVGSYALTVTDANGCIGTIGYHLSNASAPVVYSYTNPSTCGSATGSIYLNVYYGSSPYTYHWSNSSTNHTETDSTLAAGTYSYTVTDANGCSVSNQATVTSVAGFTAQINQSSITCPATSGTVSVSVTGAGPYTYLWNNGATTSSISNIQVGSFVGVTVTDGGGCYTEAYDTIQSISPITLSFAYSPCSHQLQVSPSGGATPYTYVWNTSATTASIAAAGYTSYYVNVTDANGCTQSGGYYTYSTTLQFDSVATIVGAACSNNNGSATVSMRNGIAPFTYLWSNGATGSTASSLAGGTYHVTATDAGGCTASKSIIIPTTTLQIDSNTFINPDCRGNLGTISVRLRNGVRPFTYLWSTGATDSIVTNLTAGSYTVTVTDAAGCTGVGYYYMSQAHIYTYFSSSSYPGCNNASGVATINANVYNGGTVAPSFSYLWSTGATSVTASGLSVGEYYATVTDATSGCSTVDSFSLNVNNPVYAYCYSLANPSCGNSNGSLRVNAYNGGGIYTYHWSTGATTATVSGLAAGIYTVTVSDNNGCSTVASATLVGYSNFYVNIVTTPTACDTSIHSGAASAIVTGTGNAPYHFIWTSSYYGTVIDTTQSISGLYYGEYLSLTVTDDHGCQSLNSTYDSAYIDLDPSCYDHILGNIYVDANGNCQHDAGESALVNAYITASDGAGHYYYANTDSLGNYDIAVLPGTYALVPSFYSYGQCVNPSCANTYSITFATAGLSSSGNNFAVGNNLTYDLVVHPGTSTSTPGSQKQYWVYYYNQGQAAASNAVVSFTHDPALTLVSTSIPYSSYNTTTHVITWNVGNVPVGYQWHYVNMTFDVPSTVAIGTVLTAIAEIDPIAGDCNPADNISNISDIAAAAHDPNEKEVSPVGNLSASDTVLHYTIRFQNNGNAPASRVVVSDQLSSNVNPASVIAGAASAAYHYDISGTGLLTFTFDGINLPDSTHGDSSRGFVNYTVHTKANLPLGSQINNTASIVFNINSAILTNTTVNVRSDYPNGISTINDGSMSAQIVPNPVTDKAIISFKGATGSIVLTLTDELGNTLLNTTVDNSSYTLDAKQYASGMYFYTARDINGHHASGKVSVVH